MDLTPFITACEQAARRARDVMDSPEAPHRAADREAAFRRVLTVLEAAIEGIKHG